jgi:hypothetical protein
LPRVTGQGGSETDPTKLQTILYNLGEKNHLTKALEYGIIPAVWSLKTPKKL